MSLKDALAGIKEAQAEPQPEQLEIQDVTGEPIPKDVQIAAARVLVREAKPPAQAKVRKADALLAKTEKAWRRGEGKSSNPDYERLNVYVRSVTRKAAARKWEDTGHRDLSDLIENLLIEYLNT